MAYDRNDELEDLYNAFNGRDIEAFLNHLHPDVDWAEGPGAGRIHGRQEVGAFVEKAWKSGDPRVEPMRIDVSPAGDRADVLVHQIVHGPGGSIGENAHYIHAFSFDGAFIRKLDILEAPEEKDDEDGEDD